MPTVEWCGRFCDCAHPVMGEIHEASLAFYSLDCVGVAFAWVCGMVLCDFGAGTGIPSDLRFELF